MNGVRRISLAEFSRLYLRSLDADVAEFNRDLEEATEPPQLHENRFAVQVVLGMSCRNGTQEQNYAGLG